MGNEKSSAFNIPAFGRVEAEAMMEEYGYCKHSDCRALVLAAHARGWKEALAALTPLVDAVPGEPAQEAAEHDDDGLLTGQAQYLIGALMGHGLLARSMPEDQYLKLWDVVKRQLRCVNREGARAASPNPQDSATPDRERAASLVASEREELERLRALVNSPETRDFLIGVRNEVSHQVEKWGTVHDRAKAPADWFWLVGYLGGKALAAHLKGDTEKAMHHCISTSAVLASWHTHILHGAGLMQPGSADLQDFLRDTFGAKFIEHQSKHGARASAGEAQS